jgi:hypothetical protein
MKIAEDERPFLVAEARALAEHLDEQGARERFEEIAAAAEAGEVPEPLADSVGALASLGLETGRVRSVHGAPGVRAMIALWKRTPQGEAAASELDDLNTALSALRGLPVESVRVAASAPGSYSLSIGAGDYEIRLVVDRSGVRLGSLNVGGGGIGE